MYYGLNTATAATATFGDDSTDFFSHFPPPSATLVVAPPLLPLPPLVIPGNEYDSMSAALNSEVCHSSSSCSSYNSPSSLMSCSTTQSPSLIQRSVSSHSLRKNNGVCSQPVSSSTEFVESESSLVRRVFSTGDLHRIHMMQHCHRSESSLSNEISIIEGMNKACRYSPEEKKERIERYRSKRTLRNFNKKIKYACRKTLADSRPRIRGRFARNDEIEKSSHQNQWSHIGGEEDDEDDDNWINFLDAFSANLIP